MILAITVALFLSKVEAAHGPISHDNLRLDAALTQSDVVTISERAGVAVTTSAPSQEVTEAEVDTYLSVFHDALCRPKNPASEKPKKQKPRKHRSPSTPEDAL